VSRSFETIFRQIDLRPGDRLTVVTDTSSDAAIGRAMAEKALEEGADAVVIHIAARSVHGEELPAQVAAAVSDSDVAILLTSVSASYAPSVTAAVQAGVRILSMPGVQADMFDAGAMTADYDAVQDLTERWGERFARGRTVTVTTTAGTNITANLGGWERAPLLDTGRLARGAGALTNMPAGEVAICPIEGSAQGHVVVDMTVSTTPRPVINPVHIEVKDGRISDINGGDEAEALSKGLDRHGSTAYSVAEIALGTNQLARHIGVVIEDEKALGSGHLGFGHAVGLGGSNVSGIHVDGVFSGATMAVDGVTLVRSGQVAEEGLARERLDQFAGEGVAYERGPAECRCVDGRLEASWKDLHGITHWSQAGDEEAARAAAAAMQSADVLSPSSGSSEARVAELLTVYGVLKPADERERSI
jgi:leucyl aminopeptidase (aminopeptidase T)